MNKIRLILAPIILATLLATMGCTAAWFAGGAAAGVGTYSYVTGELKSFEEVPLDRAWSASQQAMADLQFTTTSKAKDAFAGEVIARRASGQKVQVRLKRQSERVTEIKIRVGVFGDEAMSREILRKIKAHF